MIVNDSNLVPLDHPKFYCSYCDFTCSKKSNWDRHVATRKHTNGSKKVANDSNVVLKSALYTCVCGKVYKWDSGYYRHKKTCSVAQGNNTANMVIDNTTENDKSIGSEIDKEMLIKMLLKNQEVMEKMMEMMPNIGNITTNSHNTTNNNQFNIQMVVKR